MKPFQFTLEVLMCFILSARFFVGYSYSTEFTIPCSNNGIKNSLLDLLILI